MANIAKHKITLGIAAATFIGLMAIALIPTLANKNRQQLGGELLNKELIQLTSEWNKHAPLMLNADIRIDNLIAGVEKTLQVSVTIVSMTKDELSDSVLTKCKAILLDLVKTDPEMEIFRQKKVSILFMYKDMNGSYICDVTLTPDMYN